MKRIYLICILILTMTQIRAADSPDVLIVPHDPDPVFTGLLAKEIQQAFQFRANANPNNPVSKVIYPVENIETATEADFRVLLLSYRQNDTIGFKEKLQQVIIKAKSVSLEPVWYHLPFSENSSENQLHQELNRIAAGVMEEHRVNVIDYYNYSRTNPPEPATAAAYLAESLSQWWTATAKGNRSVKRVRLWTDKPPFYQGGGEEFVNSLARIDNVVYPELELFLPETDYTKGSVLFFPGGAYQFLGFLRNARELAEILNPHGIAVVGLKYRTKRDTEVTLTDARRAVRYLRAHRLELGLPEGFLGVVGQSAGAHLLLNLCSNYTAGDPTAADPVERESSRPDFCGIFSSWNFDTNDSPFKFRPDLPPFFIRHAEDDPAFELAKKLKQQITALSPTVDVKFLPDGGHSAFEIKDGNPGKDWPQEFLSWLSLLGY